MGSPPERFVGDAVVLRRAHGEDVDALFEVAHDADVTRDMDWTMPQDVRLTGEHVALAAEQRRTATEFQWLSLAIGTAAVFGTIFSADFGYFNGHAFRGRGFARSAVEWIVEWLKQQSPLYRIRASTDEENRAPVHRWNAWDFNSKACIAWRRCGQHRRFAQRYVDLRLVPDTIERAWSAFSTRGLAMNRSTATSRVMGRPTKKAAITRGLLFRSKNEFAYARPACFITSAA